MFTVRILPTAALFAALLSAGRAASVGSAQDEYPYTAAMGSGIEGASVDSEGNFYAANATTFVDLASGSVILTGTADQNLYASSRFTKTLGILVGDAKSHKVFTVSAAGQPPTEFLGSPEMLQPNDMAISECERYVYLSGMNYTNTTVAGEHGDLWYYDTETKALEAVDKSVLAAAGIHRTNGIELSVDDKTLYVTSAQNINGSVVAAKIFAFVIDSTGKPIKPRVALDLYAVVPGAATAQMDPDGMRIDTDGTIYLALNAYQKVLKWNPKSEYAQDGQIISLPTVKYPSNLELAGSNGTELVVIGRCADGSAACSDKLCTDVPGKAWAHLADA